MIKSLPIICLLAFVGACSFASMVVADSAIADKDFGLSKTSVFDTPQPSAFEYPEQFPGVNPLLPRAYLNAPPQIPHSIDAFLPVGNQRNMCVKCHDRPDQKGKVAEHQPTPIPVSHYTDLRNAPGKVTRTLIGARYICTQCHVPQANVKALVENSFSKGN